MWEAAQTVRALCGTNDGEEAVEKEILEVEEG
jgi:hypothetical protein